MIKWIFFDVGNVIFNDDPGMAEIYRSIYQAISKNGYKASFRELLKEREKLILEEKDSKHHHTLAKKYLGKEAWPGLRREIHRDINSNYLKYNKIFDGVKGEIEKLSAGYSLGILANQVSGCSEALDRLGILKYFKVHGISEDFKCEKPSLEFFRKVLEAAGAVPSESIMIGDRIDNDIIPAKKLGMKTIWIDHDLKTKGYDPSDQFQKDYFESQLAASVQKFLPENNDEKPDVRIQKVTEISNAVSKIGQ